MKKKLDVNSIKVELDKDTYLVVEKYKADKDLPYELTAYIYKDGCITQDIALIRPSYKYINGNVEISNDMVDVLVWGNAGDEDYSEKYGIEVLDTDNI